MKSGNQIVLRVRSIIRATSYGFPLQIGRDETRNVVDSVQGQKFFSEACQFWIGNSVWATIIIIQGVCQNAGTLWHHAGQQRNGLELWMSDRWKARAILNKPELDPESA